MPQAPSRGVLLCASTTALAGPIGFVGLMIPHLMRLLLGPDMRKIPAALCRWRSLSSSVLPIVLGRILGRPGELESGIVTGPDRCSGIYLYHSESEGEFSVKINKMKNQLSHDNGRLFGSASAGNVFTALTLLFLTFALACIMMIYGNTIYSPKTVLKGAFRSRTWEGAVFYDQNLRLPGMLTAILCGLAFGMAGNTFSAASWKSPGQS